MSLQSLAWRLFLPAKDRIHYDAQSRMLWRNSPFFLLINFLCYCFCTLVFWEDLNFVTHLFLGVALIMITLVTLYVIKRIATQSVLVPPYGFWRLFSIGWMTVLWWNVYGALLIATVDERLVQQFFLILCMVSLAGVALVGSFGRAYTTYLLITAIHMVLAVLTWNTDESRLLAGQFLIGMLAQLFFLRVFNDKLSRLLHVRRENSELVQALQQKNTALEQANLSQSRYLSAASHDLRQPLHALALLTNDAQRKNQVPEVGETLKKIELAIDSLSQSFNAMLNLSRLDAGVVKPQFSRFPIQRLFHRLHIEYEEVAASKGLSLTIVPSKVWVLSDEGMLYSILSNFVSNALRYTDTGGVALGVRHTGEDSARLMVYDTGSGVPTEKARQIFQEYLRLENAQQRVQGGVGLGLAISERMARLLGATLLVQSVVNQGSSFGLVVSKVPAQEQITETTVQRAAAEETLTGLRVAIIDDDETVLMSLEELLESWGMDVTVVLSVEMLKEAIVDEGAFDLVIADYHLSVPEETGLDVLSAAREMLGMNQATCMLLTGDTSTELATQAHSMDVIVWYKPLRPARLRAYLNTLWSKSHAATVSASE